VLGKSQRKQTLKLRNHAVRQIPWNWTLESFGYKVSQRLKSEARLKQEFPVIVTEKRKGSKKEKGPGLEMENESAYLFLPDANGHETRNLAVL